MNKTTKRIGAALMALVLLLSLAACTNDGESGDGDAQGTESTGDAGDYHYALTSLSTGDGLLDVRDMALVDGTPYLLAGDESYQIGLYRLDTEAGAGERLRDADALVAIAPDGQGGLWALETPYDEDTEEMGAVLLRLNAEGETTGTVDFSAHCTYAMGMAVDGDGGLYILDAMERVLLADAEGEYTGETAGSVREPVTLADGRVAVYDLDGSALCAIDPDRAAYGDTWAESGLDRTLTDGVGGYDLYSYDDDGVYGWDLEAGTAEKLLDWLESDMAAPSFCAAVDGETLLAFERDLLLLTRQEGQRTSEKIKLTLATTGLDSIVEDAVTGFNRTDSQYQIEIVNYSQYNTVDDTNAGATKLNTEILSGDMPDLIDLTGLTVQQYAEKGLLTDLGALMDGDDTMDRGDYTANILEALEIGGTLYSLTPAYEVSTVAGRASLVGDTPGWTIEAYQALLEETGAVAFANLTQAEFLALMAEATMGLYTDWESGTCDFTSGAFAQILALAAAYPAEIDQSGYTSEVVQLETGAALLTTMALPDQMNHMIYETILGGDLTFIGFPTPDGTGGSAIVPAGELGIMTGSENQEGAWAFLRYLLSAEYQDTMVEFSQVFPLMQSSLEALLTGFTDLGAASGTLATTIDGEDVEVALTPLAQETVEHYKVLIQSLDTVRRTDNSIMDIIMEEAESYFSGTKSADETAELIQNRVSTYMNEQN